MDADWRSMTFSDVPTRKEFESLTLTLLGEGITNSDQMRDKIRRERHLKSKKLTGRWNATPDDKFVNEHAWSSKI